MLSRVRRPMHKHIETGVAAVRAVRRRDWRHIHHSPIFWFGFCLFLVAITIYVLSQDLSWHPRMHPSLVPH